MIFLTSCAPAYIWDLEYKVRYCYVANAHGYKYVYLLYNGRRAMYLHTDREYKAGDPVHFNQN